MFDPHPLSEEDFTLAFRRQPADDLRQLGKNGPVLDPRQKTYHILAIESHQQRQLISLEDATYTIGRHKANAIVLENRTVSRHHAVLLRVCDPQTQRLSFRIIDGDLNGRRSHNGLWVNGERCLIHDLQDHDLISFGEEVQATYFSTASLTDPIMAPFQQILKLPNPVPKKDLQPRSSLFHKVTYTGSELLSEIPKALQTSSSSDALLTRLSSFPELTPLPIIETDLDSHITYINPAAILEFPELRNVFRHPLTDDLYHTLLHGKAEYVVREVQIGSCTYEQAIYCILPSGLIRSYFIDISRHRQVEQKLRQSEARYAAAARGANDGLWDWDLNTNVIYFSDRWKWMLGYDDHEIANTPEAWFERIHAHDRERVMEQLSLHLQGDIPQFACEYRMSHRDGRSLWFRCRGLALRDDQDSPFRIAGSQTDVTAYYDARAKLEYQALHDDMTGLPNRVLFMDRLQQAFKHFERNPDRLFAVLFLDLDRFKLINDSLGHTVGDQLLIKVAQRLQTCVRQEDTVARLGGDEFAVLININESCEDVGEIAARILQTLKQTFCLGGMELYTSASIGIALANPEYTSPNELLQDADTAMYRAKQQGKNCYELFSSGMRIQANSQLQIEVDLQRAIANQEFSLVYQPIVVLNTQKIMGFEALLRWQHPERGLVSPAEFIPVAEEAGLMISIDWWVLATACAQMATWIATHSPTSDLTINVNISAKQFLQTDFCERVSQILAQTGLPPSRLKLEITEGVIINNATHIAERLSYLKALDIKLAIDDFGTGYSSLSYLYSFPLDVLKIDYSFVSRMDQENGLAIVRTIVTLGHNLQMEVVAEGVETETQRRCLQEMGCEFAQGYLFSRPLKPEDAVQWLTEVPQTASLDPIFDSISA